MAILAQQLPAPPPQAEAHPVAIDSDTAKGLEGSDLKYAGDPSYLKHALRALFDVAAEYGSFFLSAFAAPDWVQEDDLLDLMRVYGRWLAPGTPSVPGDLVGSGDMWGLAVGGDQALMADGDLAKYELGAEPGGQNHWRPSRSLAVDPGSPTGIFWGPVLGRYRSALSRMQGASYFAGDFMVHALLITSLPLARDQLMATLYAELQPVAGAKQVRPGTVLLSDDEDKAALVVTDTGTCRAAGTRAGLDFHLTDVPGSGCDWLWVPRIV
jgi:hypothetical protein